MYLIYFFLHDGKMLEKSESFTGYLYCKGSINLLKDTIIIKYRLCTVQLRSLQSSGALFVSKSAIWESDCSVIKSKLINLTLPSWHSSQYQGISHHYHNYSCPLFSPLTNLFWGEEVAEHRLHVCHSHHQRPCFFSTCGLVQLWKSAIHRLPVKSNKSDWLRIWNEYSAHAQKIRSSQRSWFLVLTKRSTSFRDKNKAMCNTDTWYHCGHHLALWEQSIYTIKMTK